MGEAGVCPVDEPAAIKADAET
jgi:hypothetical protein